MTKVKNLRIPRKYKVLKEIFIFIMNASLLYCIIVLAMLLASYTAQKLRILLTSLFAVGVFIAIYIITVSPIYNEVYKISFIGDQVMFYTPRYVYTIRKKECKEVLITNQSYLFFIGDGIKLKCNPQRSKVQSSNKKKTCSLDEFNKKNFPITKITDKRI